MLLWQTHAAASDSVPQSHRWLMIVYKFGGATTRTRRGLETLVRLAQEAHRTEVEQARRCRRARKDQPFGLVLVVSAIGHTTRNLRRAAELSASGNLRQAEESLSRILAQHRQLAVSLDLAAEEECLEGFEEIGQDVRALMEGIAITRELSPRTRDAMLASGERFATVLIESLLHEHGLPVRSVDARRVIVTNEDFGHATPKLEEIEHRVRQQIVPRLRRSELVLTQGFIGATLDGITTTMGSESSDLTATILGAALAADEVVIWKTVPGILSSDPELVEKARLLKSLSFDEAEEIGRRGARILFPQVAHPLLRTEHPTVLRIATPGASASRATVLSRQVSSVRTERPLALALEQHLIPIRLRRTGDAASAGVRTAAERRVRTRSREAIERALYQWWSPVEVLLLVGREERAGILADIDRREFEVIEEAPVSTLSLVLRRPMGAALPTASFEPALLRSLRQFQVRSVFPIENSVIAVLADSDGQSALRKLHKDLFEG